VKVIFNLIVILTALILFFQCPAQARPSLKVGGIVSGAIPMAIVNGELVKEGDVVLGAKVVKIGTNYVKFKFENEYIIEYLGGRGPSAAAEKKPKSKEKAEQPKREKSYYEGLLEKREKAKAELKKVEQRNIDAEAAIKGKIEALRGTGATDLLSGHSAKDEEEGKTRNTWP
jgi:hypothetical protein